ncbi:MAG TPA: APC family permease [Terriglobia bacterium]|nr:APC family permease [Terriglobia bacterium]
MSTSNTSTEAPPHLKRVLTLWDLILYGIVLIMPIAPVPLFGVVQKLSDGHAVTTILLSMLAMLLTAFSYGRMAAVYPSAGSAYTFVGYGLNPHLGFLAGWAMFLDYLIVPLICTVYGALTVQRLVPEVPYVVLAAAFAGTMTLINLRGIRTTARTNFVLATIMSAVILVFIALALRLLFHQQGWHGVFSTQPFYSPTTFHVSSIAVGTSVAALTYIGFDGITTLAEDALNPRRNVLLATVSVCLFTGLFGGLQIYLAQRVWPDWHTFPNLETAYMDVTQLVGGKVLFQALAFVLILANLGSGLSGQAGLSRLLFGMGRDNVIPRRFFAYLSPKRNNPSLNIILIGLIAFLGAIVLNYERAAELINFGAFLAFMGVNAAALREFYLAPSARASRRLFADAVAPVLGIIFCFAIWMSLATPAKVLGGCWFVLGTVYDAIKTRGFKERPAQIDFREA